jgi:hypothetical protein
MSLIIADCGQEEALALKKKREEEARAQKILANDRERARYIVNAEKARLDGVELSLEKRRQLEACLLRDRVGKNPVFLKKTSPVSFFGFWGFFSIFAQKRVFRVFSVSRILVGALRLYIIITHTN